MEPDEPPAGYQECKVDFSSKSLECQTEGYYLEIRKEGKWTFSTNMGFRLEYFQHAACLVS